MEAVYEFTLQGGQDVQKAEIYDGPRADTVNIALTEEQSLRLVEEILAEIEYHRSL